ncbi:MAG: hypothetical protein EBT08_01390 [Betaproteobacteria bacterium]|nr:hypothetical protein [Betaproteobacteria bacterium]
MAKVLAIGASATIATVTISGGTETTGTPTPLLNLISVGPNSATIATSDQTGIGDGTLVKYPARIDPGTVSLEFFLDDTATSTNQLTTLRARLTGKTKSVIAVDFTGTAIDTLITYTGYITDVTSPNIAAGDDTLKYQVTLTISSALTV